MIEDVSRKYFATIMVQGTPNLDYVPKMTHYSSTWGSVSKLEALCTLTIGKIFYGNHFNHQEYLLGIILSPNLDL